MGSFALRTIGYDDGVLSLNGFVCDSFGEVDCEEDRVHVPAKRIEWSLEENCSVSAY